MKPLAIAHRGYHTKYFENTKEAFIEASKGKYYGIETDAIEDIGYPDHSGAFIGVYVSGDNGMYISLTDFSNDATGIDMLDEFCDVMGIISPVAERE